MAVVGPKVMGPVSTVEGTPRVVTWEGRWGGGGLSVGWFRAHYLRQLGGVGSDGMAESFG